MSRSPITFTTLSGDGIDLELREDGVERIEIIEGLYGGRLSLQATLDYGEWHILAEWMDERSTDYVLMPCAPDCN